MLKKRPAKSMSPKEPITESVSKTEPKLEPKIETKVDPAPAPEVQDLSRVIEESKQAIQATEAAPIRKKRGPYKKHTAEAPQAAPEAPKPVNAPSPMVPMYAQGHKVFFKATAKVLRRSKFELEDEQATALGFQFDQVLNYYLPDLEKDPKKAALYAYLATVLMAGIAILQTEADPKPKSEEKPKPEALSPVMGIDPRRYFTQPNV